MSMTIPSINASPASREYPTPRPASNSSTPTSSSLAPFTRSEKIEIHQNKMLAAALASIPVIGFLKPIWDALFYHPEKAAARRPDVLAGKRSLVNAQRLEQEKKKSQIKAALLPALIVELGFIMFGLKRVKLINELLPVKTNDSIKKAVDNVYYFLIGDHIVDDKIKDSTKYQHLMSQEFIFQILNIVTPLGLYALFEKPESPEFNKAL
ncbi:MAG: hypothetical protein HEQ32_06265 [Vampirovibrio sp.]